MKNITEETKQTKIFRSASWFRPYTALGKEIKRVIIYKDGEILYRSGSGWLEHNRRDVIALTLSGDLKKANKENLNRKDNYTLSFSDNESGFYQTGTALYIYANVVKMKEVLDWEDDHSRHFYTEYKIELEGVINELDRQDDAGNWTYKDTTIPFIIGRADYRSERTAEGAKIDAMSERLEKEGIKLSDDDIEKLINKFGLK